MNALKDSPVKYLAMAVYGILLLLAVVPRVGSFVAAISRLCLFRSSPIEYVFAFWVTLTTMAYWRSLAYVDLRAQAAVSMVFFLSLVLFAVTAVRRAAMQNDLQVLKAILYSSHVFIFVNFVGYLLGFRGEIEFINSGDYGDAKLLALLGLNTDRILFPLAPGLTTFGVVAGASFCVAVFAGLNCRGGERWMNVAMIAISGAALLLSDARGSLLFCFVTISAFFVICYKTKLHIARHLVLPFSLLFVVLLTISLYVLATGQGSEYSRGELMLSGREVVWANALLGLSDNPLSSVIGYGYMGHYVSGVSQSYSFLFDKWGDGAGEFFTLHNFMLQLIYDVGLLGYLAAHLLIYVTLRRLARIEGNKSTLRILGSVYILYSVAAGASESALSVYSFTTFAPVLLLLSFVSYMNKERLYE